MSPDIAEYPWRTGSKVACHRKPFVDCKMLDSNMGNATPDARPPAPLLSLAKTSLPHPLLSPCLANLPITPGLHLPPRTKQRKQCPSSFMSDESPLLCWKHVPLPFVNRFESPTATTFNQAVDASGTSQGSDSVRAGRPGGALAARNPGTPTQAPKPLHGAGPTP